MTIENDLVHPDPTRRRYNLTRVRAAHTAEPDELVACRTSIGAITVTLPAAPSVGACVAVGDDDGDADANVITIASAATIEGEASVELVTPNGIEQFIFDGSQWVRIGLEQLIAASRDIPVLPIRWLRSALGVGAGSSTSRLQDPSRIGESAGTAWTGGNFTTAIQFRVHRPLVLVGADVWVQLALPRDIKVTLYNALSVVIAQKTFAAVPAASGRVRFLFDANVAIPAVVDAGGPYRLGVYDTSGSEACGTALVATDLTAEIGGRRTHLIRPDVYSWGGGFTAGDAYPGVDGGTTHYPICPAFTDDSRDDAPATIIS